MLTDTILGLEDVQVIDSVILAGIVVALSVNVLFLLIASAFWFNVIDLAHILITFTLQYAFLPLEVLTVIFAIPVWFALILPCWFIETILLLDDDHLILFVVLVG